MQSQEENEMGNMDLLGNWTVEADQLIVHGCAGFYPVTTDKALQTNYVAPLAVSR